MKRRPRIGITMRLEIDTQRFYLGRDYSEAVEASGGIPVHIGLIPKREYLGEALSGLDGVLLPGSNTDLDPAFYGEEPNPRLRTVVPSKDETDGLVLEYVELMAMPLLGICYGMQALNVSRGGSLIQDIGSVVPECVKHDQGIPYDRVSHSIQYEPGTRIADLALSANMPNKPLRVNSSHHQSVRELGKNLRATAWATDGVIECIEDTRAERFVLGVQWHPEMTFSSDEFSRRIFARFVECCSASLDDRDRQ